MRSAVLVLLCLLLDAALLTTDPSVARAQPAATSDAEAAARVHFDQGKALAGAGKYREAYFEFEAGYKASRRPAFLFNMGEAARRMGDASKARAAYAQYLAADAHGSLAATARKHLAELGSTEPPNDLARPPAANVANPTSEDVTSAPARDPVPATKHVTSPTTNRDDAIVQTPRVPAPHEFVPVETSTAAALPYDSKVKTSPPRPIWKKWPIWVAVGGAVVAGAVVATIAMRRNNVACDAGCLDLR